ncbi:hypothetical protein E4U55_002349 [Claviceps digitariae]|nr:hypothetical protein E4U55_002349 [Claviceps digitariae]
MPSSADPVPPQPPPPYEASQTIHHPDHDSHPNSGIIQFELLPNADAPEWRAGSPQWHHIVAGYVSWHAVLTLSVRDVPLIMRQGLRLSAQNIEQPEPPILEEGPDLTPYRCSLGWSHYRRYTLRDGGHGHGQHPQWEGSILVYANGVRALSRFRLQDMSFQNVRFARGQIGGEFVYQFDRVASEKNYNVVVGAQGRMHGWWPWLNIKMEEKQEAEEEEEEKEKKTEEKEEKEKEEKEKKKLEQEKKNKKDMERKRRGIYLDWAYPKDGYTAGGYYDKCLHAWLAKDREEEQREFILMLLESKRKFHKSKARALLA